MKGGVFILINSTIGASYLHDLFICEKLFLRFIIIAVGNHEIWFILGIASIFYFRLYWIFYNNASRIMINLISNLKKIK